MSQNKKAQLDTETMLMTLDQLGQTIDIMTSVIVRLRDHIEQSEEANTTKTTTTTTNLTYPSATHTLH